MKTRKHNWTTEISSPDDLPEPLATIAGLVGVEQAIMLVDKLGGERIYLPCLSTLRRQVRDRKIQKEFTGYNIRTLAQKYTLSAQRVRQILKDVQPKRQKPKRVKPLHEQIRLF